MASSDPNPADPAGLTDSARANRAFWDGCSAEYQLRHDEALGGEPAWGLWRPPAASPPIRHTFVTLDWARRWPAEEIWTVRKT